MIRIGLLGATRLGAEGLFDGAGLPELDVQPLSPTAAECSRQSSNPSSMSSTYVHARTWEPSPWMTRSRPDSAASMKARIAPPPIWPGP